MPWAPDVQVVYEHLHRYLWARELVAGRDVLDLGSGEGFGAEILAQAARSVHGIDLDPVTVEHARLRYSAEGLTFDVGDATALEESLSDRFDVVVAFEVLEHVENQAALLDGVKRVLRPGGVLVISTPNRLLYEAEGGANAFHLHELSDIEFTDTLKRHFANHRLLTQRVAEGSRIDAVGTALETNVWRVERHGEETWEELGAAAPYYLLAVCSDDDLPEGIGSSTLLDHSLGLLRAERDATANAYKSVVTQVEAERDASREAWQAAREAHDAAAASVGVEVDERRRAEAQVEELLAARALAEQEGRDRALDLNGLRVEIAQQDAVIGHLRQEIARTNESVTWRGLQKLKGKVRGRGSTPSPVSRAAGVALRSADSLQRARKRRAATSVPAQEVSAAATILTVPRVEQPDVSIVIPVYSGRELTEACLRSIVAATLEGPSYEVIIGDDCADADTKELLSRVDGIRIVVNDENQGFLRTVNRAAEQARGKYLVLLNNDTEPQPGWLQAVVSRLESSPTVGAVGGRLVYPDGRLQEAGGVLFADGSAVNYGNGTDPYNALYRFARPVDYCSAALLGLRTDVWQQLGGFDDTFSPGYYEDTDLCFRLRREGYEVWFEPGALVLHREGGSHGTDVTVGVKRHQVINQRVFAERWKDELRDRPATATPVGAAAFADRRDGPVVLIADHLVPEPDRDSGSLRMFQIIEEFVAQGSRVVFLPANRNATPGYAAALERLGVEVLDGSVSLQARLADLRPQCRLAILSRPAVAAQLLPEIRAALPAATVLYDTVDLHWAREDARREFENVPEQTVVAFREIELALIRASDITAVVTRDEAATIEREVPDAVVAYLPNVHAEAGPAPDRESRSGLLFVGGFRHVPNVDAARQLGLEIMPAVRERGLSTRLTLVGPDAPPEVVALEGSDLEVRGWVPEVEPLIDASVALVAPLRYGAGMKGKVGQALAHGLPVITTAVGAQGFGLCDGVDALIAETPDEFAAAIERLLGDADLWARLSAAGPAVIARTCSKAIMAEAVSDLLAGAGSRATSAAAR